MTLVLFYPPSLPASDWNEDGSSSGAADGDGGEAGHRVRSPPPETGKETLAELPRKHASFTLQRSGCQPFVRY